MIGGLLDRARRVSRRVASAGGPRDGVAEIKAMLQRRKHTLTAEQWASWHERGYLVLPRFFSPEQTGAARAALDELWNTRASSPLTIDLLGRPADDGIAHESRRHRFAQVDDDARREVYKLNDAFLEYGWVRDLSLDAGLVAILTQLLDHPPVAINTLLFERGSTQPLHFDTYYMPARSVGGMTATWIALEPGHADAGPLVYLPGSHHIPAWHNRDGLTTARNPEEFGAAQRYAEAQVAERGLATETFVANEGDVFIWHEQLYRGGGPIADTARTRKSLVTHYWRASDASPDMLRRHRSSGGFYLDRGHASL